MQPSVGLGDLSATKRLLSPAHSTVDFVPVLVTPKCGATAVTVTPTLHTTIYGQVDDRAGQFITSVTPRGPWGCSRPRWGKMSDFIHGQGHCDPRMAGKGFRIPGVTL